MIYPDNMMASWYGNMETLSTLLALCEGNPPVDSLHKVPVTPDSDSPFNVRLDKLLIKHSSDWWFETPRPLCDTTVMRILQLLWMISSGGQWLINQRAINVPFPLDWPYPWSIFSLVVVVIVIEIRSCPSVWLEWLKLLVWYSETCL